VRIQKEVVRKQDRQVEAHQQAMSGRVSGRLSLMVLEALEQYFHLIPPKEGLSHFCTVTQGPMATLGM
jgi:hypothetical protein